MRKNIFEIKKLYGYNTFKNVSQVISTPYSSTTLRKEFPKMYEWFVIIDSLKP